ncbi:MAG: 3-deoxy-8-phosphooctulonate synthase [Candidatus Omnitrophica bacterium]|nr:3-deoxy-8-phosphooctulonate synthase [Candidatus Omnitrophota bacterium]MDD5670302.1 3-deoxy-8-phosphooctulonate synthase [Candidatus Omnitrophota bacterium]
MPIQPVSIGSVVIGDPKQLVLIGGPCVIETEEHTCRLAEMILRVTQDLEIPFVFKASYDKANRSSSKSFRGPGLEKGLKTLARVKREFKIPVLSDVHSVDEVKPAGEVLDIIQIPAFLCRQTDLILAAGKTGRVVNVKKGQFLAPWDVKNIVDKLEEVKCHKILLTERGVSFGYQYLVNDFRAISIMRGFGYPVIYDATHSVQLPGGKGTASGGTAEFIPMLARCGVVAGADAVFMEIHDSPAKAFSDGANVLEFSKLGGLLEMLMQLKRVIAAEEKVLA